MPRPPDSAAIERLARHLYYAVACEMLRVRGQKMTPYLEFPCLPHDEQGAWRVLAKNVAADKHRHTLMD